MSAPNLAFRNATSADIQALVALVTSAYRGEASRAGWTTEADFLDGNRIDPQLLRDDIQRAHSRILIAERSLADLSRERHERGLLACAHVAIEQGAGYFGMFSVRPDSQHAGIGSATLAEAERIVQEEWQQSCLRMTVIDLREELIAWYQRRGYRRTGVFKPFPYGDARFGIPKRDDLRFEVLEKNLQE